MLSSQEQDFGFHLSSLWCPPGSTGNPANNVTPIMNCLLSVAEQPVLRNAETLQWCSWIDSPMRLGEMKSGIASFETASQPRKLHIPLVGPLPKGLVHDPKFI